MDDEVRMITVLVDGEPRATYIDEFECQRFVPNDVLALLFKDNKLDMDAIYTAFMADDFNLEAYQEFYQHIGFSVSGFEQIFGVGSGVAEYTGKPVVILNPVEGHGQTIQ